jgi:hypothetical protein
MEKTMKWRFTFLGSFVVLALCPFSSPIHAQTAETAAKASAPLWYDIAREVTLTGTVRSVVEKTSPEMKMLAGSHLYVESESGKVIDASLGGLATKREGALAIAIGEHIQLTGVMKLVNNKEVLFTRLIRTNNREYKIRNEHGYTLAPESTDGNANSDIKAGQR